jgi:hypothetical protein
MLVLGTGGAGGGDLVFCEAAQDDDMVLIDCLERVSCAKVFALIIINVCIHGCLFLLGNTLGKISKYVASRARCRAGRD